MLVEVSHTDLSEVTRMVFIQVGTVVMLTTCETSTTGMLAVLSYTTVTGGDVTAAAKEEVLAYRPFHICCSPQSILQSAQTLPSS